MAVFQWGWARQLLGITPSQTISFLPILLIAITFGLSSDYEVFLVSRIKTARRPASRCRPRHPGRRCG